ncbi:DUF1127 domain-containing protein [Aliagarivorans marinus]|uniref:DUF1127 domain-containing protein n=1 Tax=Aliagarivorans marinus TaxID=561965 RepID=UPI00041BC325|nr:hypothetical protein [Aliagarivorans marinus]
MDLITIRQSITHYLNRSLHNYRSRRALYQLATRQPERLQDLGLSQAQALSEATRPFWQGDTEITGSQPQSTAISGYGLHSRS